MDINKEIIMTIVKNSKGRLEYDQEFFEINEEQLTIISKELTKLFSLHGVVKSFYCYDETVQIAEETGDEIIKCDKQCEKCKQ